MINTRSVNSLIILVVVIFFTFNLRHQFIAPPSIDYDHAFNVDQAFERLSRILGDEAPHPVDSDANDAVRARLVSEIRSLGFEPLVRDDFHCSADYGGRCARVRNVLFWVTPPGPNAVMVTSHYDSVPAGPGASDDGSGVAASLEIAHILKRQEHNRPLLILITDGEEAGLIGASSFVVNDPLSKNISAVVNMEARGVRGVTTMIETSRPNGRDLGVLSSDSKLAIASSLNADIYEMMPNGTDMTAFLKLDIDAANYAYAGGAAFYHTPSDNLANLDKRALFHLGVSGLNATEVFLQQSGSEAEVQWLYADLFGATAIIIPQYLGQLLIALGCLVAILVFFIKTSGHPFRSAFYPPLAIILGLSFAIGITELIAWLRPEAHFGAAHPWALRATQNAAALLGGVLAYAFSRRKGNENRLSISAWFWFGLLGLAASSIAKGAAILFVPSLVIFIISATLYSLSKIVSSRIVSVIAVLLFTVIALPLTAAGEMGLFIENAAAFALVPLLIFILLAPMINSHVNDSQRPLLFTVLVGLVISTILASLVPAYNSSTPAPLSIIHVAGDKVGESMWSIRSSNPIPDELLAIAPFTLGELPNVPGKRYLASAPDFESYGVNIEVLEDTMTNNERLIKMKILTPDSDRIWMPINEASAINYFAVNDQIITIDKNKPTSSFLCYGRACRTLEITLKLDKEKTAPELIYTAISDGLDKENQALVDAKPDWVISRQWGDVRAVTKRLPLN